MKLLRLWLLVLLAVLLPVRGAMAAAMLCPPAGVGTQTEMMSTADHHLMDHGSTADHGVSDGTQDHTSPDHGHHGDTSSSSHQEKCNLCSAFCSVTSMPSEGTHVPQPPELTDTAFPDFSVPAPSFLSGRQERPPRSI